MLRVRPNHIDSSPPGHKAFGWKTHHPSIPLEYSIYPKPIREVKSPQKSGDYNLVTHRSLLYSNRCGMHSLTWSPSSWGNYLSAVWSIRGKALAFNYQEPFSHKSVQSETITHLLDTARERRTHESGDAERLLAKNACPRMVRRGGLKVNRPPTREVWSCRFISLSAAVVQLRCLRS